MTNPAFTRDSVQLVADHVKPEMVEFATLEETSWQISEDAFPIAERCVYWKDKISLKLKYVTKCATKCITKCIRNVFCFVESTNHTFQVHCPTPKNQFALTQTCLDAPYLFPTDQRIIAVIATYSSFIVLFCTVTYFLL